MRAVAAVRAFVSFNATYDGLLFLQIVGAPDASAAGLNYHATFLRRHEMRDACRNDNKTACRIAL